MGYMNKILRINLTKNAIKEEKLDEKLARNFVGGRGLGARIILDEVDSDTDALSENNRLVFLAGPLTGTKAPTSGRFCASFKSPLTGTIADSQAGGAFAPWLKRAGYDAAVIEGKAPEPEYLLVSDDGCELYDASLLWGRGTKETCDTLEKKHDGKALAIGQAGERLSLISSVMVNGRRALGRCGIGAVMGSKNLKAVVVKGNQKIPIANEKKFERAVFEANALLKEKGVTGEALPDRGTTALVHAINMSGLFPVRNFQQSQWGFENAEKISGEAIRDNYAFKRQGCYGCPIICGHFVKFPDGKILKSPEFETDWSFGADCDNSDFRTIAEAGELCDDYGLDTISTGATIAAAMELEEKGKINAGLKWGDGEAIIRAVHMIAKGEGIGKEMALGSRRFCEKYNASELAMSVKGLELPAYDPRGAQGQGLSYATSNRGGCHLRAYMIAPEVLGTPALINRFSTQDKARCVIDMQNWTAFIDSLVLCEFTMFSIGIDNYADMYSAATGFDTDAADIMKTGERIWNIERMYNIRACFKKDDDTLPQRLLREGAADGPAKGEVVKLKAMLNEYYALRGWTEEGMPLEWKLKELELT